MTLVLSSGEEIGWVRRQVGHTTTEMIIRRYYKWIRNNARQDGSALVGVLHQAGLDLA